MTVEAMTFRAEPEFMSALRTYANQVGLSVNSTIKKIVAPVIGVAETSHDNGLSQFCGCLPKGVANEMLEFVAKADFSKVDPEDCK